MQNGMPSGPGALLGAGLKTACRISSGLVCGVSSRGVGYVVPGMSDRLVGSAWGKKRSRRISTLRPVSLQSVSTVSLRGGNCGRSGALSKRRRPHFAIFHRPASFSVSSQTVFLKPAVITFLIFQALLFSTRLYSTQSQLALVLCHCLLAVLVVWIASQHSAVHLGHTHGPGVTHGVACSIATLIALMMCSALLSMSVMVWCAGVPPPSRLLNSEVSLQVSIQSLACWGCGGASSADRSRMVRIGRWSDNCWWSSETSQASSCGVSTAEVKHRLIVLHKVQARHVVVPKGSARSRSTTSTTSIRRSATPCCVRQWAPSQLGWCRLKSPTTMWVSSWVACSRLASVSMVGMSMELW